MIYPSLAAEQVLYSDDQLIVVNKPADLLSVPGKGEDKQDCLWRRAQTDFPTARIVHRLDYATSGVMVIALSAESHRHLSMQFQNRETDKYYRAVIAGSPAEDQGLVDLPLRCDWDNRPLQMVDHEQGKPAQTRWEITQRMDDKCQVNLYPVTGRSHQLRVHMLALGHPIVGDRFYASEAQQAMAPRLLLHAEQLTFSHPASGESLTFTAPADF
ncbi:RluA family pseudouridine synthase [Aliamphritea hakodatensis]|uniref:RluA family pseudouridine synthase n=1 Tax=Aliamphritea hakodatensis TaxID=2895352 RepID=UPI0022FD84F9|nr:RluA family pseudouridine synthase [Aliamphritea hakodatensis]